MSLESDICMKCYDHWNFLSASVVQFRVSRWVMSPYRTFVWKVITIRISRESSLFNLRHLYILCPKIGHPCEKLWPFEFLEIFRCSISSISIYYFPKLDIRVISYDHSNLSRASVVQFRASRYIMSLNRTCEWNVMTIWIFRELPLFNFKLLDILCTLIGLPCDKLWPIEFIEGFRCAISRVSVYYAA